jgi:hypothetical protein
VSVYLPLSLLGNEYTRNNRRTLGRGVVYAVRVMSNTQNVGKEKVGESETSRVEAGSNTSIAALRIVGGDEKGTRCLGV